MSNSVFIPGSLRAAGQEIRVSLSRPLHLQTDNEFLRAWCSVAYLFPGLHPDGFEEPDSGWPRILRSFAAEAWRRADASDLADDELYPGEAQWCGLYDRMTIHLPDETERRVDLAAAFGESPHD
jgi:hypothetical protein